MLSKVSLHGSTKWRPVMAELKALQIVGAISILIDLSIARMTHRIISPRHQPIPVPTLLDLALTRPMLAPPMCGQGCIVGHAHEAQSERVETMVQMMVFDGLVISVVVFVDGLSKEFLQ